MSHKLTVSGLCFILFVASTSSAIGQVPPRSDRQKVLVLPVRRQVPEATLPCSPEEAKWWQDLRAAADAVRKTKAGAKEKQTFLSLLQSEPQNAFQAPVPDRKITVLSMVEPKYTDEARRNRTSGRVLLQVEFRADGTIGDVEIERGLRPDLDREAVKAARRTTFLPAVKERKFVSSRMPMEMGFHLY